jgi:hypothetical protein
MADPFDIGAVVNDVIDALNGILNDDVTRYVDFAHRQTTALALQASAIAQAFINGDITEDDRDWHLKNLAELSENFARAVAGLTVLTIEKAWNAIVGAIWKAITGALTAALNVTVPIPKLPRLG